LANVSFASFAAGSMLKTLLVWLNIYKEEEEQEDVLGIRIG
jgi:hypothetical protein